MDNLEQMVAERTMQLDMASDIAGQMGAILDSDELLNTAISLLKERFGLYYVHVYTLDEDMLPQPVRQVAERIIKLLAESPQAH